MNGHLLVISTCFLLWSGDQNKPANSRGEKMSWQLFSPLFSPGDPAAVLPFQFTRCSNSVPSFTFAGSSSFFETKSSNKCTDELEKKRHLFTWDDLHERKERGPSRKRMGELPSPTNSCPSCTARQAANGQWILYFTKAPSWRNTAFVPKWQDAPQGQAFSLFCEGYSPALAHSGFQGMWGCSSISSAVCLGITERWLSWHSPQCHPQGHQQHGWWKCPIVKWLSGRQRSSERR